MVSITNSDSLRMIEENYFAYMAKKCLDEYKWEGQFEDGPVSLPYENLTHFHANNLIEYIPKNLSKDLEGLVSQQPHRDS